ncbi:ATP phosphoribosyltransferase regulatory subunit [uncultured Agitococcus sp.]|uniref:ATP phosphoribosyltransferase regulatory subunit n=1 Tax=uncultured Agitococcus sp. TaxID=1506599 RepID=UPI002631F183|nr:ATP phosphoribosyltransferase regulatory subunit [uncultured Agitococcus sp.]
MVTRAETWLLPDGIQDVLPKDAIRLEALRRRLLDLYQSWGYELVFPPLVEYLESLLTGSSHDLELMTCKITDQLTGRLMGVRADITPQVARLDAHCLPHEHTARYCYSGTILTTLPQGLSTSRAPIQIGAELYGCAGVAADIEIIRLMLTTLLQAGVPQIHLDLGHVAVFRELAKAAQLSVEQESQLFDIYQRKSLPELQALGSQLPQAEWFVALGQLSGGVQVIEQAQLAFANAPDKVKQALADIQTIVQALQGFADNVSISVDLSELRGYHYHTGLVFAAYTAHSAAEIAKGGRYDCIGEAFGRARPATGFSADLKTLVSFVEQVAATHKIFAPAIDDNSLQIMMTQLRYQGHIVIQALTDDRSTAQQLGCTQQLVLRQQTWQVEDL